MLFPEEEVVVAVAVIRVVVEAVQQGSLNQVLYIS